MFVLEKHPELITEEIIQPKGFGIPSKAKNFKNPIWLGRDYRIQYVSKAQSDDTTTGKGSP